MVVGPRASAQQIDLPQRLFLYTVDQIATVLGVTDQTVKQTHLFFDKRNVGAPPKDKMLARNIAPQGERPDWRVTEKELLRWLRYKGFRVTQRGVT